jgi:hypothetical protein
MSSREDIVACLAPCGLDCNRCVWRLHGEVQVEAERLVRALEGFDKMAPLLSERVPALAHYEEFLEVLSFFSGADCLSCRDGGSQLSFCSARVCFREKGVDFCFECDEYPCTRNRYPENLLQRWRTNNDRMREVGVERYYQERLERPRY